MRISDWSSDVCSSDLVETPLDRSSLDAAIAELKRAGVTSVAVAYLPAYCNDAHEPETFAAVRAAMPEVGISLSCAVLPQIKEYERVSTTLVNAIVAPLIAGYPAGLAWRGGSEGG